MNERERVKVDFLQVSASMGTNINVAIYEAARLALTENRKVVLAFNGKKWLADPTTLVLAVTEFPDK